MRSGEYEALVCMGIARRGVCKYYDEAENERERESGDE